MYALCFFAIRFLTRATAIERRIKENKHPVTCICIIDTYVEGNAETGAESSSSCRFHAKLPFAGANAIYAYTGT